MPLNIVNRDITALKADAIVCATNRDLIPGSDGVDGAIHEAAGPGLAEECRALGGCEPGQAKATGAYGLQARYVIHTVGPFWRGGGLGEEEILSSCYRNCLRLAAELGAESVAFPLISAGNFRYPRDSAMRVAVDTISSFLLSYEGDMDVTLALYKGTARRTRRRGTTELDRFLRSNLRRPEPELCGTSHDVRFARSTADWADESPSNFRNERRETALGFIKAEKKAEPPEARRETQTPAFAAVMAPQPLFLETVEVDGAMAPGDLERRLRYLDESFSEMVFRIAREKDLTNPQIYKASNLDRKLFSKIQSKGYVPSKKTALALAIGLKLDEEQAAELLLKAGYALSNSNVTDVIVSYFISRGEYDINVINEALYDHDQQCLGSSAA